MPSILTKKVKLHFDVGHLKRGMADYFAQRDMVKPFFRTAHVFVAGILEHMCDVIVDGSIKNVELDSGAFRVVTTSMMKNAILLNEHVVDYYGRYLSKYDPKLTYIGSLPVTKKDLEAHIEARFGRSSVLKLDALDFLAYLLCVLFSDICRSCGVLLAYGSRKTITADCIRSVLKLMFSSEDITLPLEARVSDLSLLAGADEGKDDDAVSLGPDPEETELDAEQGEVAEGAAERLEQESEEEEEEEGREGRGEGQEEQGRQSGRRSEQREEQEEPEEPEELEERREREGGGREGRKSKSKVKTKSSERGHEADKPVTKERARRSGKEGTESGGTAGRGGDRETEHSRSEVISNGEAKKKSRSRLSRSGGKREGQPSHS